MAHSTPHAASLAALALAAYGAGLPAMALVRIVASTFYARHDTMTPARATVTAIVSNIALKVFFVWGLHLGVAGVALGTALGAWINVGDPDLVGQKPAPCSPSRLPSCAPCRRYCLRLSPPAAGAWLGARAASLVVQGHLADMAGVGGRDHLRRLLLWRGRADVPHSPAAGTTGAMRLFVALAIPAGVAQSIMLIQGGVPGARWQTREQLHLTLRFIGEVDGRDAACWTTRWQGSRRRLSICNSMAWASSATSSRTRYGRRRGRARRWRICSARWMPPSAAWASRRTRTNSLPM